MRAIPAFSLSLPLFLDITMLNDTGSDALTVFDTDLIALGIAPTYLGFGPQTQAWQLMGLFYGKLSTLRSSYLIHNVILFQIGFSRNLSLFRQLKVTLGCPAEGWGIVCILQQHQVTNSYTWPKRRMALYSSFLLFNCLESLLYRNDDHDSIWYTLLTINYRYKWRGIPLLLCPK